MYIYIYAYIYTHIYIYTYTYKIYMYVNEMDAYTQNAARDSTHQKPSEHQNGMAYTKPVPRSHNIQTQTQNPATCSSRTKTRKSLRLY